MLCLSLLLACAYFSLSQHSTAIQTAEAPYGESSCISNLCRAGFPLHTLVFNPTINVLTVIKLFLQTMRTDESDLPFKF